MARIILRFNRAPHARCSKCRERTTGQGTLDERPNVNILPADCEETLVNDRHVVFGTGAIGLALIDELATLGVPVRAINRSGRAEVRDGVEVVAGIR